MQHTETKELVKAYKREFKDVYPTGVPQTEEGHCGPPRKRTKTDAVAAGNRVITGRSAEKEEAYKDVDIYTISLWYHDKVKHTLYDLGHQLPNVMKQMFSYVIHSQPDQEGKAQVLN